MLINALCDYYDMLAANNKILPDGYGNVKIHYLVCLTPDGKIDGIIDIRESKTIFTQSKKTGEAPKEKIVKIPRETVMPLRTQVSAICANVIEHRSKYLFGLELKDGKMYDSDSECKGKKPHEEFVNVNLEFLRGMDSPVVNAFRNFILNWVPAQENENPHLLGLGKEFSSSGFVFCLSGEPQNELQDDPSVRDAWVRKYSDDSSKSDSKMAQCAITGEIAPIARIHNKIVGVYEGASTGSVLVNFNNPSECSYGIDQAYNSNISVVAMNKYTEALNYLLHDSDHKIKFDDITVVFWAMSNNGKQEEDLFKALLCENSDGMDAETTEKMLKSLLKNAQKGKLTYDQIKNTDKIDEDVDFYMLGLKPNSSRLSVKFIYHKKYADMLYHIVELQNDLQINQEIKPVSLQKIIWLLKSPKSKNDNVSASLFPKLFETMIYGGRLPQALLETAVRRVKVDKDINIIRAGIIKACINRNYNSEEFGLVLDQNNTTPAYLCGRLFAVLEKLQQDASNGSLNNTIKDSYFASAAAKPALVFPKLIKLSQAHLKKMNSPVYYNKLIGEIVNKLSDEFPDTLLLVDQGRFYIGYYQQYQSFFDKKVDNATEDENNGD